MAKGNASDPPDGWQIARMIASWMAPRDEAFALTQIDRAEERYVQNAERLGRKSKKRAGKK